jgi:hypothetical protein
VPIFIIGDYSDGRGNKAMHDIGFLIEEESFSNLLAKSHAILLKAQRDQNFLGPTEAFRFIAEVSVLFQRN